ncbi:MAG: methyltransferase domain-containing protein [Magnetococcales bacterium]|nr:methyltransferase domain-containing protein [Magnetococcales bacterium]
MNNDNRLDGLIRKKIDIFCCPKCTQKLSVDGESLVCQSCTQQFNTSNDIPQLFIPTDWRNSKEDVTEKIKDFYETTPFPNYDEFDDIASLRQKSRDGLFAKLLEEQIPMGYNILECGCGTGQLSNFLAVGNRSVFATDMCMNSLNLAHSFKLQNDIQNVAFVQMNLFRPCFAEGVFDLVVSNGVLHHTGNPHLGFETILKLVKPKGYIIIGLYHKYGRVLTDIRRFIFNITGDRFKILDSTVSKLTKTEAKKDAWFKDQYKNPHESKHTLMEVLQWLDNSGVTFVKSIPKTVLFEYLTEDTRLFEPEGEYDKFELRVVELGMLANPKEGGFFIVIGQKN